MYSPPHALARASPDGSTFHGAGTLTPIVKDPDRAFMSDQMRQIVRSLATLFPTAIVSGRGREKVRLRLAAYFISGSHSEPELLKC